MGFILRFLLTVVTILLISQYVPGIEVASFYTAFVVAIILGIFNLILKPILFLLTLPINLLTFGLFSFVINALLFWLVSTFIEGFTVEGFIPALVGSLILTIIGWVGHRVS